MRAERVLSRPQRRKWWYPQREALGKQAPLEAGLVDVENGVDDPTQVRSGLPHALRSRQMGVY
jgi:hypothetical protein